MRYSNLRFSKRLCGTPAFVYKRTRGYRKYLYKGVCTGWVSNEKITRTYQGRVRSQVTNIQLDVKGRVTWARASAIRFGHQKNERLLKHYLKHSMNRVPSNTR